VNKTVTWIAAALLILPAMLWAAAGEAPAAASEYTLTVLNPQGPVKKDRDLAPRLETLKGKKVAMWLSATADQIYAGKGAELFDSLEKMLKEKYPDIEIVSYRDLPMKFAPENEVVAAITKTNPDAVVAGFGG
jgi:ABC-type amino acid transport substrate-binding protein